MDIIKRAEWGARPSGYLTQVAWGNRAVLHHTADTSGSEFLRKDKRPGLKWFAAKYRMNKQVQKALKAFRTDDARLREIESQNMRFMQGYHMSKGWSDLGYHYVIYPSGNVYEGRPNHTQGAHALNGNYMPGISFAMNSEVEKATPQALEAFEMLCHELGVTSFIGHRWVPGNSTACPGKNLIAQTYIDTRTGIGRI